MLLKHHEILSDKKKQMPNIQYFSSVLCMYSCHYTYICIWQPYFKSVKFKVPMIIKVDKLKNSTLYDENIFEICSDIIELTRYTNPERK